MKKFYSILALAFMCMVGTISAETLKLSAEVIKNGTPSVSDAYVRFTLNGGRYERPNAIRHWEDVWMLDAGKDISLTWELLDAEKTIKINSVRFYGRGEGNGTAITAQSNYMPVANIIFKNEWFDFGKWDDVTVPGSKLFGPTEDLEGGAIKIVDVAGRWLSGSSQLQFVTIDYTVVEKAATHTVYATPENEVVFGGDWTASEISEALEGTIPVRGGGELDGSQAGIVNVTEVEGLDGHTPIIPSNPNTLIEANEGQVSNPQNVIVDNVINNLVVVDPLQAGYNPQDGRGYNSRSWNVKREGLKALKASYTRPMTYHYATVCIPFSYNAEDVNANVEDVWEADFWETYTITTCPVEDPNIPAGYPVIVFANEDIVINAENVDVATEVLPGYTVGTFAEKRIGMGEFAIAMDKFWNAGYADNGYMTVMPFRSTFLLPGDVPTTGPIEAKAISIVSKDATAINNVEAATTIAPTYNLQGVRVAPNAKGFVIANGKKYFNK